MSTPRSKATARQRRYLNLLIAATLLAVAVVLTPGIREQVVDGAWLRWDRTATRSEATLMPVKEQLGEPGGETSLVAAETFGGRTAGAASGLPALAGLETDDRVQQQLALVRQELLERQRRVAAREAALQQQFLAQFWMRQAAAAGLTIALTLVAVALLLRYGLPQLAGSRRWQREEGRLRKLQLSVIDGLEELRATLEAARKPAASMLSDVPLEAIGELGSQAPESRPQPAGQAQPTRVWADDAQRESDERGESERTPEREPEPDRWPAHAPLGSPAAARSRHAAGGGRPTPSGSDPARRSTPRPDQLPVSRSTSAPAAARRLGWAERFVRPDALVESRDERGPWGDPPQRRTPPAVAPAPRATPAGGGTAAAARPGLRAQIEYLSACGLEATEIARRLQVSHAEVRLALSLRVGTADRSGQENGATE